MKDNGWFADPFTRWSDPEGEVAIRKNAATPHPCSSYCCGNPRKWFGELTWQEVRAGIDYREQVVVDDSQDDEQSDD